MTYHNITPSSEAHWSAGDRFAVRTAQVCPARTGRIPWAAVTFFAVGILTGVAGVVLPALAAGSIPNG